MRKLLIAVLAVVAVLAVASVAVAANVYKVHLGSTTVKGKGTKAKPIPTGLKFGFQVEESDPTKRATVIEEYAIGSEGLVANPKLFPKCNFTELDDATVPTKLQEGTRRNGPREERCRPEQRTGSARCRTSTPCNLRAAALQRRRRHDASP